MGKGLFEKLNEMKGEKPTKPKKSKPKPEKD